MAWEKFEDVEADFAKHGEAWVVAEAASGRRNERGLRYFREWQAGHDARTRFEQDDRDRRSLSVFEASAKSIAAIG